MIGRYQEEQLVRIARRENNKKRNYLVVNRLQGKHIPVRPREALDLFRALAEPLKENYAGERLLLIGFAETATAIGAAAALELGADYMQTTREQLSGVDYLYFSEEHSHATQQKLVKNDIDAIIDKIDRIVFIEDEVTTGKTILNIIDIMEKVYPNKIQFSVASVLNGMDGAALARYAQRGIALFWLVKTDHAPYAERAEAYRGDGKYVVCGRGAMDAAFTAGMQCIKTDAVMDTRRLVTAGRYAQSCEKLFHEIAGQIDFQDMDKILVLGTEELMYPPLYVAWQLEKQGMEVRFHATTRSPIMADMKEGYPLHTRYELRSFYDKARTAYIYDLDRYDGVLVITDAPQDMAKAGICSLGEALALCGNERIILVDASQGDA